MIEIAYQYTKGKETKSGVARVGMGDNCLKIAAQIDLGRKDITIRQEDLNSIKIVGVNISSDKMETNRKKSSRVSGRSTSTNNRKNTRKRP